MDKKYNIYSIHYSCSGFHDGGAIAPTICCIALFNIRTKKMKSFSITDGIKQGKSVMESEQNLLKEFVEFFNSIKTPFIIHWNMDSLEYGFKAIMSRCENFGLPDLELDKAVEFNLSKYSKFNLMDTLEISNNKSVSVLTGKQEAYCFNKRDFKTVKLSTEAKAFGIAEIFKQYVDGNWKPDNQTSENTEKELVNTPTGLKLYKLLCGLTKYAEKIHNILTILKTDSDKEFLIQAIEQGKTDINLLEFLANEYIDSKNFA